MVQRIASLAGHIDLPLPAALRQGVATALLWACALLAQAADPVAQVTLVAGPAQRIDTRAATQGLVANTPVYEGDRIQTGPAGLVHLRFADGAHVGLRENSELKINAYRASPAAIELELTRGAVRQISGAIAREQPKSFRLNTPIAAIGVRGTDFVSGYTAGQSFALLLDGAIVIGARDCVGECQPVVLAQPHTLATVDTQGRISTRQVVPGEIERIVGAQRLARQGNAPAVGAAVEPENSVGKLDPLPETPPGDPLPAALVWSRWLAIGRLPENFAVEYDTIAGNPDYALRATNLSYNLWRYEPAGSSWTPGTGTLDFRLNQAAAHYTSGAFSLPVVIENGTLSLDLGNRGFATQLSGRLQDAAPRGLESLATTQTLLDVRGQIDSQGRLLAVTTGTTLNGAIALDKSTAAYLFSTKAAFGKIEGITTWQR